MEYWEACFEKHRKDPAVDYDGWLSAFEAALPCGGGVLDLGCGSGTNIAALLSRGMHVTAADLSCNALDTLRTHYPGVKTVCMDMTQPFPFAQGQFDAVTADLSLHYFSWADTQQIVAEIAQVLRPGGMLFARVHSVRQVNPDGLAWLEENYYIYDGYPRRYFTREALETLFAGWGFSAQEQEIIRFGRNKHVFVIAAEKPRGGA